MSNYQRIEQLESDLRRAEENDYLKDADGLYTVLALLEVAREVSYVGGQLLRLNDKLDEIAPDGLIRTVSMN